MKDHCAGCFNPIEPGEICLHFYEGQARYKTHVDFKCLAESMNAELTDNFTECEVCEGCGYHFAKGEPVLRFKNKLGSISKAHNNLHCLKQAIGAHEITTRRLVAV